MTGRVFTTDQLMSSTNWAPLYTAPNLCVPALRGFLTGIVRMMKLAEIFTYRLTARELRQSTVGLAAAMARESMDWGTMFDSAMATVGGHMIDPVIAGLDPTDDCRVFVERDIEADDFIITIRLKSAAEERAAQIARELRDTVEEIVDGELQKQEAA